MITYKKFLSRSEPRWVERALKKLNKMMNKFLDLRPERKKRRYKGAFISKLSDAETEAAETQVWSEITYRCKYIEESTFQKLNKHYDQIIGKLIRMIDNPDPWLINVKETGKGRN